MKKLIGIAIALFSASSAQSQLYGELGYTSLKYKESGEVLGFTAAAKSSPSALRGVIGYEVNPNLGLESIFALGLSGSDYKVTANGRPFAVPGGAELEVNNALGFYLKPKTKLGDNLELFGRLGFLRADITLTALGESIKDSGSGLSGGAGLSYLVNPTTSVTVDYMQYYSKDGVKINGYTVGFGFKF